jgi:hypothetical protein
MTEEDKRLATMDKDGKKGVKKKQEVITRRKDGKKGVKRIL